MSTATIQDFRRTDLRVNLGGDPFWMKSKVIDAFFTRGLKDKACVLFSFPTEGQQVIIREIAVRVLKAFTANTTLELGTYTLATDGVETGDSATVVDTDMLVESVDITAESVGWYYPSTGGFTDARGGGVTVAGANLLEGTATTVPAIVLTPKVATILDGQVQVLILACIVPQ